MSALALGVDLGGTKIEVAVVEHRAGRLEVHHRARVPTLREQGYEAIRGRVGALVRSACAACGLDPASVPIGVGMPGGVERRTGLIKNSNTTCLNGRPFRADLQRDLARQLVFDNDANCFALAETMVGAARAYAEGVVFGVILGTGVGGGVVTHGKLWSGRQGIAGEWGHHALPPPSPVGAEPAGEAPWCYCGQRGCVEAYASGPAIERYYAQLSGGQLPLVEIAARTATDAHAAMAVERLVDTIGRGLANVIDVLDPSVIVLGGGVSNLALLYDQGRARVARYVFNDELETPLLKNELGDSAGVFGAALLALAA